MRGGTTPSRGDEKKSPLVAPAARSRTVGRVYRSDDPCFSSTQLCCSALIILGVCLLLRRGVRLYLTNLSPYLPFFLTVAPA